MRRKDREVTDYTQMLEILRSCDCCRLGLVDGEEAYIVPMNFGLAQENGKLVLYFHTATEGRKIDLLKKQTSVSFQTDTGHRLRPGENAGDFSYYYQCVMGKGTAELLSELEDKIRGFQSIMSHYSPKSDWNFDVPCLDRVYVIKLIVTDWTCKVH